MADHGGTNGQSCGIVSSNATGSKVFKQVAKKSTSSLPQKLATRDVQNGHVKSLHNTVHSRTSQSLNGNSSSDASDDEESVNSNKSCVGLTVSKIKRDDAVSAENQMANIISSESCLSLESDDAADGKKSDADVEQVITKFASRLSDGEETEGSDGIVVVNDSLAADVKSVLSSKQPDTAKRPSDDSAESTANKKVRLEETKDCSDSSRETIVVGHKTVREWCFALQKMCHDEEVEQLKKKVRELQDSCERWKKLYFDLERKFEEGRRQDSKAVSTRPVVGTSTAATNQLKKPGVTIRTPLSSPRSLMPSSTAASPVRAPRVVSVLKPNVSSPNLLPPASARLRMPASAAVSSAPSSSIASSALSSSAKITEVSKGVIDLTDDDVQGSTAGSLLPPANPLPVNVRLPLMNSAAIVSPLTAARPAALILNAASTVVRPAGAGYAPTATIRPVLQARTPSPMQAIPIRSVRQYFSPTQPMVVNARHPAPLPLVASQPRAPPTAKRLPTKPTLKLSRVSQGIVLSWNMATTDDHEAAVQYQLFAYQQGPEPPSAALWKKVGTVKALPLPMACTLTQFQVGNRYHFAVRAVDCHGRIGAFSEPGSIHLEALSATS